MESNLLYQGAAWCKVLDASGKNPAKTYRLKTSAKRHFESATRGFVWTIEKNNRITRDGLELVHKALVLQISVGKQFSIELLVKDQNGHRRRLLLSTAFPTACTTPLHAQLPLVLEDIQGTWTNWCLDLEALTQKAFGVAFHALNSFSIRSNCKLRMVLTARDAAFVDVPECFAPTTTIKKANFPPIDHHQESQLHVKGERCVPSSKRQQALDPPPPPSTIHIAFGSRYYDKVNTRVGGRKSACSEDDATTVAADADRASPELSRTSREFTTSPEVLFPIRDETEHHVAEVDCSSFAVERNMTPTLPLPPHTPSCLDHLYSDIKILPDRKVEQPQEILRDCALVPLDNEALQLSPPKVKQDASFQSCTDDLAKIALPPNPSRESVEYLREFDEDDLATCTEDSVNCSPPPQSRGQQMTLPESEADGVDRILSLSDQDTGQSPVDDEAASEIPQPSAAGLEELCLQPARDIEILPVVVEEEEIEHETPHICDSLNTENASIGPGASFPVFRFQELDCRGKQIVGGNAFESDSLDSTHRTEDRFHDGTSVLLESANRLSHTSSSCKHRFPIPTPGEEDPSRFALRDANAQQIVVADNAVFTSMVTAAQPQSCPQRMETSNDVSDHLCSRGSGQAGSIETGRRFDHTVLLTSRYGPRSSSDFMRESLDPPPSYVSAMAHSCFGQDSEPKLLQERTSDLESSRCWMSASMVSLPAALEEHTSIATPNSARVCVDDYEKKQMIVSCSMHSDATEFRAATEDKYLSSSDEDADPPPDYDDAVSPLTQRGISRGRQSPAERALGSCQSAPASIVPEQRRTLSISSLKAKHEIGLPFQHASLHGTHSISSKAPGKHRCLDSTESRTSTSTKDAALAGLSLGERALSAPLRESHSTNSADPFPVVGVRASKSLRRSTCRNSNQEETQRHSLVSTSTDQGSTAASTSTHADFQACSSRENLLVQGERSSPRVQRTKERTDEIAGIFEGARPASLVEEMHSHGEAVEEHSHRHLQVDHSSVDQRPSGESQGVPSFQGTAAVTHSENGNTSGCQEETRLVALRRDSSLLPRCDVDDNTETRGTQLEGEKVPDSLGGSSRGANNISEETIASPISSSPLREDENATLLERKLQELAAMEASFRGEFGSLSITLNT